MRYDKQTRSPYHKYGKRPYAYSEAYERWHDAMRAYGLLDGRTVAADAAFRKVHNIPEFRGNRDFSRLVEE